MAATNEAKIREACKTKQKTHRIDKIRKASGIEDQAFDDTLAKLAREGVIELTGGDTSKMTAEQIAGLYKSGDDDLPLVNLVWQMESTGILWRYRHELAEEKKRLGGKHPIDLAIELTGININSVRAFLKVMPFFHSEFDKLEENFESLKRSKSTLEDDDLKSGTLQRRIDSLENTLAKVKTEREFLKKSAMELSDYRRRINTLEEAHNELLKEIDTRDKEISRLRTAHHQTPPTPEPEPKQITLFDEGEKDMRDAAQLEIKTLREQMTDMQEQFQAMQEQFKSLFTGKQEPATIPTRPEPEQNHEKFKIGKWAVSFAPRQNAFVAVRRFPGSKSPISIYCKKDRAKVETILREKLALKGLELD